VTEPRRRLPDPRRAARAAPRANLIERRMSKFLREPPSVRLAASVIVTATALVVVGGGVLIWVLDHREYPNIWIAMWFTLQTVTTVGYGDVTPNDIVGRLVGAAVMLQGIAFVAIITAAITSTFVARAEHERAEAEATDASRTEAHLEARFDELAQRLDRLESMLGDLAKR
jgi:voltage-gated potassium channel